MGVDRRRMDDLRALHGFAEDFREIICHEGIRVDDEEYRLYGSHLVAR
jgi:hypothetical protein